MNYPLTYTTESKTHLRDIVPFKAAFLTLKRNPTWVIIAVYVIEKWRAENTATGLYIDSSSLRETTTEICLAVVISSAGILFRSKETSKLANLRIKLG